jgi:hypothetical protein
MKSDFVPFQVATADGSRPRTEARTEVIAGAQTAIVFHPLTQAPAHLPTPPNTHGEPSVTLERDGGRVTRIKVQCPCGQVLELACDYSEKLSG